MSDDKKDDGVTVNSDGSLSVKLSQPINIDGATLSALCMREPTLDDEIVGDKMPGSDIEKEAALLANLCMLKPADMRKLRSRDYRRLRAAYANHFFD